MRQYATGLRHAFENQYTRHNRNGGKMALEKRLVDGYIFYRSEGFFRFQSIGNDPVYKQKWVPVRKNFRLSRRFR